MDILKILGLGKKTEEEKKVEELIELAKKQHEMSRVPLNKKDWIVLGIREEPSKQKDKEGQLEARLKNFKMRPYDEHYRKTEGDID